MRDCQKFHGQIRRQIFPFTQLLSVLLTLALFMIQNSCSNVNVAPSTPTVAETITPIVNTPTPTKITIPSQTPSPTPVITGTWSNEPPMLIPRSAHAAVSSDSAIYALAGTDDHG